MQIKSSLNSGTDISCWDPRIYWLCGL